MSQHPILAGQYARRSAGYPARIADLVRWAEHLVLEFELGGIVDQNSVVERFYDRATGQMAFFEMRVVTNDQTLHPAPLP